jgi:hypothetical protein
LPRTKGAVGHRSLTVARLCEKLGFDIPSVLIGLTREKRIVLDKTTGEPIEISPDPELIRKVCADLMPYVYPKLSSIEIQANVEVRPFVTINSAQKS